MFAFVNNCLKNTIFNFLRCNVQFLGLHVTFGKRLKFDCMQFKKEITLGREKGNLETLKEEKQ